MTKDFSKENDFETVIKEHIEKILKDGGESELFERFNIVIKGGVFTTSFLYVLEKHFPQYLDKFKMLMTFS